MATRSDEKKFLESTALRNYLKFRNIPFRYLCHVLNLSTPAVNARLNGYVDWRLSDICLIAEKFKLNKDDIYNLFLAERLKK